MAAFSDTAFSEIAFDVGAFDFGTASIVSFSSGAFGKDSAFSSSAFAFDSPAVVARISGKPRKRPLRRKPQPVTSGWWMLGIDESGQLTDEELLLFSSIDLD